MPNLQNIERLCILRLSAIGDVCHAVAMVTRIRQQAPHIRITWVIGKIEYQLVKDIPEIEFVIFDKSRGREAFKDLKNAFKGRMFDVLFLMQVAFRANLASRQIPAKIRMGFDWARSKELHWLFANRRVAAHNHAHVLEGFMDFADAIGVPEQPLQWDMGLTEQDVEWAHQHLAELGKFVAICPAASKAERNWLPERYAAVATHIQSLGYQVVICGGPAPAERQLADDILKHTNQECTDMVGQTSLKQLLAVLQQASLVIAPDTGPAHMASTVSTPVIGLYAHSNPRRTGPYNDLSHVVSVYDQVIEEQTGKTWHVLPWGTRAKGQTLMERIEVDHVIEQVDVILTQA
ncbi:glycosyltransferase family 9 protein [Aestuariibacter salexigens]|uniref:glycosyltransferase family 9 protein n=1 Tax=Aestuariibacter salexigens TaxID=226010 RepID=UPI0004099C70|nr:glycosyltransferase family 9 protein [Aestuariibacter salexigens]